jgi:hypothetical protein
MRYTHRMLIESLVPVFGVPFAAVFAAAQIAILALMRSYRGLLMAAGLMAAGAFLGWIGMVNPIGYSDIEAAGFTPLRHILCGGAVVSGIGTGIAYLKGALPGPE